MANTAMWGNPFKRVPADIKTELKFLSSVPIFDTLSLKQLQKIQKLIHVRNYEESEVVFRQGDPGVGMYIVRDGALFVYNEYSDLTRRKIASMNPGDFFGEIALLNDGARSATVAAARPTVLFGLFRPDLMSVMDSDPKLGQRIIYRLSQIVAERLRLTNLNITD